MSRLMIVDDEAAIRDMIEAFVSVIGHDVVGIAADGEEAVAAVRAMRNPPDLVLMDFRMPRMNGLDASREIVAIRPETRVLMVTADESVQALYRRSGAIGLVEKPFSRGQLMGAIRWALESPLPVPLPTGS
jgi:CheY-like chemotaxis protein